MNCNTIDLQMQNEHIYSKMEDEQQCTNKAQEAVKFEKGNVNTTSIPNSNINPTVIDYNNSKINYFITDPKQESGEKQVKKPHIYYIQSSVIYSLELGVLMTHCHCKAGK